MTFEVVNALGEGQFFGGLPVDCAADDELTLDLGDPAEESLATALSVIETGTCPAPFGTLKLAPDSVSSEIVLPAAAPAAQRYLGAF